MSNNLESLTELFRQIEKQNAGEFWASKNTRTFKLWLCSFLLEEIKEIPSEVDYETISKVINSGNPERIRSDGFRIALENLIKNSNEFKAIVDGPTGDKLGDEVKTHIHRLVKCVKYIEKAYDFPHWNNVNLELVEELAGLLKDKNGLERFNKGLPFMVNMLVD